MTCHTLPKQNDEGCLLKHVTDTLYFVSTLRCHLQISSLVPMQATPILQYCTQK